MANPETAMIFDPAELSYRELPVGNLIVRRRPSAD
jgi:hypothetical protein